MLAAASCDLELDGRGAVHLHTVVWSADVEKLKRSNENVKARCFSLSTQLTDAQAHVQALEATVGSPSFFITMTCNPTWPEIVSALAPGEDAANRPDLHTRVFRSALSHSQLSGCHSHRHHTKPGRRVRR